MNVSEHEYLLPMILGNDKNAVSAARKIYKTTGARVHLFAQRFPFWQKLCFECHAVTPIKDEFILDTLMSYLGSIEEYYCPVIIVCDSRAQGFVDKYSAAVESACLAISYDDFFNSKS